MLPDFLPETWCDALLADCRARSAEFTEAAVGKGNARRQSSDQRRDTTLWLNAAVAPQSDFLEAMNALRNELNHRLFMGLSDYEAHYAHYARGAFYRRHRDAFAQSDMITNTPRRILSSVIYLNTCAGGELSLWNGEREIARIEPGAGTAVFFLSQGFPHEVLPAQSDRYSIAGWYRG
jgi:SM-20-related protein